MLEKGKMKDNLEMMIKIWELGVLGIKLVVLKTRKITPLIKEEEEEPEDKGRMDWAIKKLKIWLLLKLHLKQLLDSIEKILLLLLAIHLELLTCIECLD